MFVASMGCGYSLQGIASNATYTSSEMTIQLCVEVCKGQRVPIALIQEEKCFCDTSRESLVMLPQHFCAHDSPCPGNPFQSCGSREKNTFSIKEIGREEQSSDVNTGL